MLSEKEEKKIISRLQQLAVLTNLDVQVYFWMTSREFQLLATRVIELNDELKIVSAERDALQKQYVEGA